MAETSREIRRELELTRARMSRTIVALERKVNPKHMLDDHPIAMVGLAFGTGVLLATTGSATRAGKTMVEKVKHGAGAANEHAGRGLDQILDAVIAAATASITSKLGGIVEQAMSGQGRQQPRRQFPGDDGARSARGAA